VNVACFLLDAYEYWWNCDINKTRNASSWLITDTLYSLFYYFYRTYLMPINLRLKHNTKGTRGACHLQSDRYIPNRSNGGASDYTITNTDIGVIGRQGYPVAFYWQEIRHTFNQLLTTTGRSILIRGLLCFRFIGTTLNLYPLNCGCGGEDPANWTSTESFTYPKSDSFKIQKYSGLWELWLVIRCVT
jgi:hypothetical protein